MKANEVLGAAHVAEAPLHTTSVHSLPSPPAAASMAHRRKRRPQPPPTFTLRMRCGGMKYRQASTRVSRMVCMAALRSGSCSCEIIGAGRGGEGSSLVDKAVCCNPCDSLRASKDSLQLPGTTANLLQVGPAAVLHMVQNDAAVGLQVHRVAIPCQAGAGTLSGAVAPPQAQRTTQNCGPERASGAGSFSLPGVSYKGGGRDNDRTFHCHAKKAVLALRQSTGLSSPSQAPAAIGIASPAARTESTAP